MSAPPAARFCIRCGAARVPEARFCTTCGADLAEQAPAPPAAGLEQAAPAPPAGVFCPSCGAEQPAGQAFCTRCGGSLQPAPEPEPILTPWQRGDAAHPVRLTVRRDVPHGRLGAALRLPAALLAVAAAVVFLAIAVLVAVAAWPCRLVAGRYPSRLRAVAVAALVFSARASCYACMLSPALPVSRQRPESVTAMHNGQVTDTGLAVQVELPDVCGRPWLRLPALLPVAPLLVLEMLVAILCAVPAWFAEVGWGRLPDGLAEVMEQPQRFMLRFWAYALLLSDTYPWFQPQAGPVSTTALS